MESKNVELTDALHKLIEVNNTRVEGYEHAIEKVDAGNEDIKLNFKSTIEEARAYIQALKEKMAHFEAEIQGLGDITGKIAGLFNDLKWVFSAKDRKSVLDACVAFESDAIKSYEQVLASDVEMSAATRQVLISQKEHIEKVLEQLHDLYSAYAHG